jgi:hypothetical protein
MVLGGFLFDVEMIGTEGRNERGMARVGDEDDSGRFFGVSVASSFDNARRLQSSDHLPRSFQFFLFQTFFFRRAFKMFCEPGRFKDPDVSCGLGPCVRSRLRAGSNDALFLQQRRSTDSPEVAAPRITGFG